LEWIFFQVFWGILGDVFFKFHKFRRGVALLPPPREYENSLQQTLPLQLFPPSRRCKVVVAGPKKPHPTSGFSISLELCATNSSHYNFFHPRVAVMSLWQAQNKKTAPHFRVFDFSRTLRNQ